MENKGHTDKLLGHIQATKGEFRLPDVKGSIPDSAARSAWARVIKRGVVKQIGKGLYMKGSDNVSGLYYSKNRKKGPVPGGRGQIKLSVRSNPSSKISQLLQAIDSLSSPFKVLDIEDSVLQKYFWTYARTLVNRGLIKKIGKSEFEKIVPNLSRTWKDWEGKSGELPAVAKPIRQAASERMSPNGSSGVRVIPWHDESVLIIVGHRTYLATEVAMVKKGGRLYE